MVRSAEDEIGALNFQTSAEVLREVGRSAHSKLFTLGIPIARPAGDPI